MVNSLQKIKVMTEKITSQPSPTIANPEVKTQLLDTSQDVLSTNEMNKDIRSKAETLQTIGSISKAAIKNITGLIANIASYDSFEKRDFDANGNQITEGIGYYKKQYRSSQNIFENEDIAKAIKQQKQELKKAREEEIENTITVFSEKDLLRIIEETNDALQNRIFGPLWRNWTTGEDFLEAIKFTLQSLIDTYDPLIKIVDEIQEFIYKSTSGIQNNELTVKTASGETASLPLGMMAIQALSIIINYIRELLENIEMLAEEYTTEELNVLVRKGTNGANWGSVIKSLQDLIQLIIDCMKPYIHNLIMALILDAIDLIVDKLDKAGILSPTGPLKLIPAAITLVRAILRGDLEAIEEMIKKTITKMINIVQLAFIAMKDPSILWADTDRMDKEIAVARYEEFMEDGEFSEEDKDKFFNHTETSIGAGARHFLQKMKGETQETFNQIAGLATTYTDLNILYKKGKASVSAIQKNMMTTNQKLNESSSRMSAYEQSRANEIQEKNYA